MPTSSSPSPFRGASTNVSHISSTSRHSHHSCNSTTARSSPPPFNFSFHSTNCSSNTNHDDENNSNSRIPFENLDPTVGIDEAAEEIIRFETGAVVRDVTERLTKTDPTERAKKLIALREKHSLKKKVPLRSQEEVEAYVKDMIQKGEQKRQRHLIKIAKEMYPDPTPRISEKSRDLASNYRARQEEKKKLQESKLKAMERKMKVASSNSSIRNNRSLDSSLRHQEIIAERHEGTAFKPSGPTPGTPPLYLTSSPTPRVASSSPHRFPPSTEQQRMARFIELSQPREYQKSSKKSVSVVSSSSNGRF